MKHSYKWRTARYGLFTGLLTMTVSVQAQLTAPPIIQGQAIIEINTPPNTARPQVRVAKASTGEFGVLSGIGLTYLTPSGNFRSAAAIEGSVQTNTSPVQFNTPTRLGGLAPTPDGGFVVLANDATNLYIIKKSANQDRVWSTIIKTSTASDMYGGVNILPSTDGGYLVFAIHNVSGKAPNTNISKVNSTGAVLWSRDLFPPEDQSIFGNTSIGFSQVAAGSDATYLLTGTEFRPLARPQPYSGRAAKVNGEGQLLWSRTYGGGGAGIVGFADQIANPYEGGTFLVLGVTDPEFRGSGGPTHPYKMSADGSVTQLPNVTVSSQSRIASDGTGQPHYVILEYTTQNEGDLRLTGFNEQSAAVWSRTFGGSRYETPQALLATGDGYLLGSETRSSDGDVQGKSSDAWAHWMLKLLKTAPPTAPFSVNALAYDCNTGQLTLGIAGGNNTAVEFRIVGVRDWSPNNSFTIPPHQRQGTTFTLEARQSGQVATRGFTAACGPNNNPQPPTPPATPTNPSGFYLRTPAYDCTTGILTALYSNGDAGPVEYRIVGLRDWGASPDFTVPAWQRVGTTFTIEGRLTSGATSIVQFTTGCGSGAPTVPTPPTPTIPTAIYVTGVSVNCATGQVTINTAAGNGTPVDYRIPGLADWQPSPTFTVPPWQRNGTTFTAYIRQSGGEYGTPFTVNCQNGGAGRVAAPTERAGSLNAVLLPNPVIGNELMVEVSGAAGTTVEFTLTDIGGRIVGRDQAAVRTDRHRHTMAVGHLLEGIYLLKLSTGSQAQTIKVLKQ